MTPEQFIETHAEALDKRLQAHKVNLIRMRDEEEAGGRTEAVRVLGAEIDSVHEIQNDLGRITRAESVK
ncbi:hypothetical protein [Streptomyces sp. NPDC052179]|uniref:hypothetical protein n=1 Tax=unclassified Streptomyces TaxID=2593676 RepID=UPI003420C859